MSPRTSVALAALYLNVHQRMLGTILTVHIHNIYNSVVSCSLSKEEFYMGNPTYFQIT
jgi:hypothetical protein